MRDGRTNNDKQVKIELLSQWMLEAEFRNLNNTFTFPMVDHGLNGHPNEIPTHRFLSECTFVFGTEKEASQTNSEGWLDGAWDGNSWDRSQHI